MKDSKNQHMETLEVIPKIVLELAKSCIAMPEQKKGTNNMPTYIDREKCCTEFCNNYKFGCDRSKCPVFAVPPADVAPVAHGEWRHAGGDEWACTNCGNVIHAEGSLESPTKKYCHECGAKMVLQEKEEY